MEDVFPRINPQQTAAYARLRQLARPAYDFKAQSTAETDSDTELGSVGLAMMRCAKL